MRKTAHRHARPVLLPGNAKKRANGELPALQALALLDQPTLTMAHLGEMQSLGLLFNVLTDDVRGLELMERIGNILVEAEQTDVLRVPDADVTWLRQEVPKMVNRIAEAPNVAVQQAMNHVQVLLAESLR